MNKNDKYVKERFLCSINGELRNPDDDFIDK